ncbi:hypothetical protein [Thiohalorhabdus methylotrophus]|uniref:Lipoprotein n=1 Tax=Thiohalorhabdus methylotrophus TaxID=3242694 RepID=A0ABV4U1I0_9GAMM
MAYRWIIGGALSLLLIGCGGSGGDSGIPRSAIKEATASTEAGIWVENAEMEQKGETLLLAVTMAQDADREKAKYSGQQYVRQLKEVIPGTPDPHRAVGTGQYIYKITVQDPQGRVRYKGTKPNDAKKVAWRQPAPPEAQKALAEHDGKQ